MRRYQEEHQAKAVFWAITDAELRRCGYQTGLDTLVVRTVNDMHWVLGGNDPFSAVANALSASPGEYDRKVKTQRN